MSSIVFATDIVTTVLVLFLAVMLGFIAGYYTHVLQTSKLRAPRAREIFYVDKAQLDHIRLLPGFAEFPTLGGKIYQCPHCQFENTAVYGMDEHCQNCLKPLYGADQFVGISAHQEVWLRGRTS